MLRSVLTLAILVASAPALLAQEAPAVSVPAHGNSECPIMGKKASEALYVDVPGGRIYICCAPCVRKVRADAERALAAAYPTVKEIANTTCPLTGKATDADSPTVVLQGQKFRVCCAGCVKKAKEQHQLTLALLHDAKLKVVGNATCPIDGQPVDANTIVQIGEHLVHLSSPKHLAAVKKDPAAALAAAQKAVAEAKKEVR